MEEKKYLVDIEGFKKWENKNDLPHVKIDDDIEAFVLTKDGKKMFLIIDLEQRLIYTALCGIAKNDGSAFKN